MMRVSACVALLFVLITTTALGQQATIFPFQSGMMSARMAALAGSTVAMTKDPSNVLLNPAVLATIDTSIVAGTFIKHVLDINAGFATYNQQFEAGTAAVTLSYTTYGAFDRMDATGNRTGNFSGQDLTLGVSFARDMDTLISYGGTVKLLYSGLDDMVSTAIALDAGLLLRFPKQRTNVGLSILNLGTQLSTYDGVSDRLPLDMRIGVNHRLRGLPLLVNFSLNHLTDEVPEFFDRFLNFAVGGELYLGKVLQVRVGYDNTTRNTSSVPVATQLTGLNAGIGIDLPSLDFDYALSSLGAASTMHRISVAMRLD